MRALNFGFLATVGGLVGLANACGEGLETEPVIGAGGLPPQISTGGRIGTGGSPSSSAGSKATGTGGSKATGSGGSNTGSGSTGCPMTEPADGDDCTLPASGELKCTYGTTTCECEKSPNSGRIRWDCVESASGTGGRSAAATGGKSAGTGGKATSSGGTGGRATSTGGTGGKAMSSGGTTGTAGSPTGGTSGTTSKAGGFAF